MMEIKISSIAELHIAAEALISYFDKYSVYAFYGEMGAGKTTFIKEICRQIQIVSNVNSPTFAILNEYISSKGVPLFHFDFYRIKNLNEAIDIGIDDYFYSGHICFIEWPEKIEQLLPENTFVVKIHTGLNNERFIQLNEPFGL